MTPYPDANRILRMLSARLRTIMGSRLLGLYLTGSLTYGDFDYRSSDIDFVAVLRGPLTDALRREVVLLHDEIARQFPRWAKRIEGSYITEEMLKGTAPPEQARPYINNGSFWDPDPPYGNEWALNLHVLHECGIKLYGPEAKSLFPKVDMAAVREYSKKDLIEEWLPKLADPSAFDQAGYEKAHLQAYAIFTMCRILHRAQNEGVASKRVASAWVKTAYPRWSRLVSRAERWEHGQALTSDARVKGFIEFTCGRVDR